MPGPFGLMQDFLGGGNGKIANTHQIQAEAVHGRAHVCGGGDTHAEQNPAQLAQRTPGEYNAVGAENSRGRVHAPLGAGLRSGRHGVVGAGQFQRLSSGRMSSSWRLA